MAWTITEKVKSTAQKYDEIAKEYVENTLDLNSFETLKKDMGKFLRHTKPGDLILDVGSGSGRDLCYFISNSREAVGIDLSKELAHEAKKRSLVDVCRTDMRNLNFVGETFNALWVCASFLHIPKVEAKITLQEFSRVLKPKGMIYISVIEGEREGLNKTGIFFAYYQEEELINLVNGSGFKPIECTIDTDEKRGITWISVFARKSEG